MSASLKDKQIDALKRVLNLNVVVGKTTATEPQWKVLIYDDWSQDIISPIFTLKELRDAGVTLHLNLNKQREAIPDVPAVYLVAPTDENIDKICSDIESKLYESFYFNFISAIPRAKLERIASVAVAMNNVQSVSAVMDQYVQFICLEDEMFITKQRDTFNLSYYGLHRAHMTDTEMNQTLDSLADTLFSVLVTKGQIPIIQCPRGNAAEKLSELLDKKLRDQMKDARTHMFSGGIDASSLQRPLLVILDRDVDLATPLHHTWTYQALVHDVLNLSLNRVQIKEKSFDLDSKKDKLWNKQRGSPFPEVAQEVQTELEKCKSREEELRVLKSSMGTEEDVDGTTARLSMAVTSLPEILAKKRNVDMHIDIAASLLDQIKERKLDSFFEMEEKLLSKSSKLGDKNLQELLKDPEAGNPEDKVRLFIISLLCTKENISEAEMDSYCNILQNANCDLAAIQYIRKWKAFTSLSMGSLTYGCSDHYGTRTDSMFGKLLDKASKFAMEGVKNLVVEKHNLVITKIVDALMELKSTPETDNFRYFDPKILRVMDPSNIPRTKTPFQEAIVFVIGGGNYIEYQNLMDYCKTKLQNNAVKKKIIYGCSELLNATQFVSQLSQLGNE